jgi:hypothetical protein
MIAIFTSALHLENASGMPARQRSDRWVRPLLSAWLLGVLAGVCIFCRYTLIAGAPAQAPLHRLENSTLPRAQGRDTLVMVVHPQCPCSRASMSELAALAADCKNQVSIDILFAEVPGLVENTEETALWQAAAQIPGATLIADKKGALTHKLGATTSGQVFLYDADGALRFSGGITGSRGHAGNNTGRLAIEAVLRNQVPSTVTTPVFGCALW